MKSIKDFIYYYRSCPLCNSWITLDIDLPIPTALEIQEDRALITVFGDKPENNKEYYILFKTNKIESEHPFVFNSVVNIIKRLYYDEPETIKIEARCYNCNNFRYWSKNMVYNPRTKKLRNIAVSGERFQIHDINKSNEKISYVISNDYNGESTTLLMYKPGEKRPLRFTAPFTPFTEIDFNNREKLLKKIRNILLLS